MPERDALLPQLPAEQHRLPVALGREVHEPRVEVLHEHAELEQLAHRLLQSLLGLCGRTGERRPRARVEPTAVPADLRRNLGLPSVGSEEVGAPLDHPLDEGTHLGKRGIRVVDGEGASGHEGYYPGAVRIGQRTAADGLAATAESPESPIRSWRLAAWLAFIGALVTLAYVGRATSGKPDRDILYHYSFAAGALVQYGFMLGVVLLIALGLPKRQFLALRRPPALGRAAGLGLATLVGIYVVSGIVAQFANAGSEQGLTPKSWEPEHAGAYAASFVAVALVAPVVEELLFRGEGVALLLPFGAPVAVVGSALAFALAHGLIVGLPVLFAFGVGLAILRLRTRSVFPGMALHALFNAIAMIAAVTLNT